MRLSQESKKKRVLAYLKTTLMRKCFRLLTRCCASTVKQEGVALLVKKNTDYCRRQRSRKRDQINSVSITVATKVRTHPNAALSFLGNTRRFSGRLRYRDDVKVVICRGDQIYWPQRYIFVPEVTEILPKNVVPYVL